MATGGYGAVVGSVHRLFGGGTVAGMGEGELLRRFAGRRDPAAFEALVKRHGPMVLGVCRRVLADPHAVEDAFQATFLVLVKKAGSLRDPDLLGPWLHGVAHRVAVRSRANAARRRSRERPGAEEAAMVAARVEASSEGRELRAVLDEEIARLPERFRRPIVLCYLEGLTHDEAAARLRCPVGTVRSRMSAARSKLRDRLSRRGVTLPATLFGAAITAEAASAAVPQVLIEATVSAALAYAAQGAGAAMAGTFSAGAASLAEGVSTTMFANTLKLGGAVVVAALLTVGGTGAVARQFGGGTQPGSAPDAENPAGAAQRGLGDEATQRELARKLDALQAEIGKSKAEEARLKAEVARLVAVRAPARKQQFALIGKMDINRDGKDDRDQLKKMIEAAGGAVSYDLPPVEVGAESGKLAPAIDLYVWDGRGTAPEGKDMTLLNAAVLEARNQGIRPIALEKLLALLGQQAVRPKDAAPADGPAKPDEEDLSPRAKESQKRVGVLTRKLERLQAELNPMTEEINLKNQIASLEQQLKTARVDEPAKADDQGLSPEARASRKRVEALNRRLEQLQAELGPLSEEVSLKNQVANLEQQLKNIKETLSQPGDAAGGFPGGRMGMGGGMGGGRGGMGASATASGGAGGMGGGFASASSGVGGGMGGVRPARAAAGGPTATKSLVTLENDKIVVVQKPGAEKISAYSLITGEWASYAIPKGTTVTPVLSQGLVALVVEGEEVRQLAAFSLGQKWVAIDLKEPTKSASPVVSNSVAAYAVGRRVYAFGAHAAAWDVIEFEEGARLEPVVGQDRVTVEYKDRLCIFSGDTGRWIEYDEKNPAVITRSGKVLTPPKD